MTRRRSRHVDAVLADRPMPHGPIDDPDDIDALATAIELRALRPGAGQPDEAFVTNLRRRLTETRDGPSLHPSVTRRTALVGAAGALAGAAAAIVGFETLPVDEHTATNEVLDLPDGRWTTITTVQALDAVPVRPFSTKAIAGFVSLRPDGALIAVSGTCTHQGCLLQLNPVEQRLDCPCHKTTFALDGTLLTHQLPSPPAPLTKLNVRRNNDTIEALLPTDAD